MVRLTNSRNWSVNCQNICSLDSNAHVHSMNCQKVFILGAGCSVCGQYPLASKVKERLVLLESRLAQDGIEHLRSCVQQTVDLLEDHGASTLDELAAKLPEPNSKNTRSQVEHAKLAMSLLFLDSENKAVVEALPAYSVLFNEMFSAGFSSNLKDRLESSNCRILTFNYDRLFEKCLHQWVSSQSTANLPIPSAEEINQIIGGVKFDGSKPCIQDSWLLLKLHGSVAQFNRTTVDHGNLFYYPKEFGLSESAPALRDNCFENWADTEGLRSTMFFPSDKDMDEESLAERSNSAPFAFYQKFIWGKAKDFCSQASEIHIIGYSMQDVDWFSFKRLLSETKPSCKIVVRNADVKAGKLKEKMEWLKVEFGKSWPVEFHQERFYGNTVQCDEQT